MGKEKDLDSLSGPWTGLSIQDGIRISERINLRIRQGQISGTGNDKDGEFEFSGFYTRRNHRVMITRRYNWTTEPTQEGVGIAYDYDGAWDGQMISGRWSPRLNPGYGGPFEMWPDTEEDRKELSINFDEVEMKLP